MGTRAVNRRLSGQPKNISKGISYAEAWRRVKAANAAGFHFEAVTICESILSDRLLSFVAWADPSSKLTERTSFGELIRRWREQAKELPELGGVDLGLAVDSWRDQRNKVVHGLAKSAPGTPTKELEAFLASAKEAALQGAALARAVCRWHQAELKRARSGIK